MDTDLIGSQRYEFVSHQNGANFKMKRSATWRDAPAPFLSGIEYKLIQEQARPSPPSRRAGRLPDLQQQAGGRPGQGAHGRQGRCRQRAERAAWTTQLRATALTRTQRLQGVQPRLDRKEIIDLLVLGDG
jgi:hypothetical protein